VASARGRQESHDRPVRHPDDRPAVVTAFISLAVAAPVTHLIMLDGDGEHAQRVRMDGDGRRGAGAHR
jgi:hypothetical protein